MPQVQAPELTRCPLHQLVIQVRVMDAEPASLLERTLESPAIERIHQTEKELLHLGALSEQKKIDVRGTLSQQHIGSNNDV